MTWVDYVNAGRKYYCSMCRMPWRMIDGELKVVIPGYPKSSQIQNFGRINEKTRDDNHIQKINCLTEAET
jgi:hypothetical protein